MNRYLQHVAGCFKIRSIIPRARGRPTPSPPFSDRTPDTHTRRHALLRNRKYSSSGIPDERPSVGGASHPTDTSDRHDTPRDNISPATDIRRRPSGQLFVSLLRDRSGAAGNTAAEHEFPHPDRRITDFRRQSPSVCLPRPDSVSRPGKRTDGIRDMFRFSRRISRSVFFTGRVAGDGKIPYF